MSIQETLTGGFVPVYIYTTDIDESARKQLMLMSQLPIIHGHIAAMPDVHVGMGATVGTVVPTKDAIVPAMVGVDIGCGMMAARLSLRENDLPDTLYHVRKVIEKLIPVGMESHAMSKVRGSKYEAMCRPLKDRLLNIFEKHPGVHKMSKRDTWLSQMGTLGGGNHFIELCTDENHNIWLMLHSGSRGLGNAIGRYFIEAAKKDLERRHGKLPDMNLAYFDRQSPWFDYYFDAVSLAQDYAWRNREMMMSLCVEALQKSGIPKVKILDTVVHCHHNYVELETHGSEELLITRKGAISARYGEMGIVPGSMGDKSYIVKGKGHPDSWCSCSHGAGRKMSRGAAVKKFSIEDFEDQTKGIECRKDKNLIDEIPGAYKPIDEVMAFQSDLVEVVHTLKQLLCVKG